MESTAAFFLKENDIVEDYELKQKEFYANVRETIVRISWSGVACL